MRKKILLLGMSLMMLFGVSGCGTDVQDYPEQKSVHLHQIELGNRKDLYYDDETGVIYFLFNVGGNFENFSKGYMSPYYSKNGKLCKYENGQIVEITKGE